MERIPRRLQGRLCQEQSATRDVLSNWQRLVRRPRRIWGVCMLRVALRGFKKEMTKSASNHASRRHCPRCVFAVVMAALLWSACSSNREVVGGEPQPDVTLSNGQVVRKVFLDQRDDGSVLLFYDTTLSIANCKEIQREVREMWSRFLREQAERRKSRDAVLMPQDPSGSSRSYRYLADKEGEWTEHTFTNCEE